MVLQELLLLPHLGGLQGTWLVGMLVDVRVHWSVEMLGYS